MYNNNRIRSLYLRLRVLARHLLRQEVFLIWAAVIIACGDGKDEYQPACVNGEDCEWIDVDINYEASFGCAVRAEGTVWCWGSARQISGSRASVSYGGVPRHVPITEGIVDISIGFNTVCALSQEGSVFCWGDNYTGLLGDGTRMFAPAPVRVGGVVRAIQLEVGWGEACVLLDNGTVSCWGVDTGDGVDAEPSTPHQKNDLESVTNLSVGQAHACATQENGRLHCWGSNTQMQLGMDISIEGVSTFLPPYELPQPVKAIDVDCGNAHTCAVQDNGTVWCWGANYEHQLGLPVSTDGTHIPGQVASLVDIERVYAGDFTTCASNHSGDFWCWGNNSFGQLGYLPFDHEYFDVPVPYEHLSNFRSLSLQAPFAVYAVADDGTAWGWGRYEDLYVPFPRDDIYDFTWTPIRMYDPVRD